MARSGRAMTRRRESIIPSVGITRRGLGFGGGLGEDLGQYLVMDPGGLLIGLRGVDYGSHQPTDGRDGIGLADKTIAGIFSVSDIVAHSQKRHIDRVPTLDRIGPIHTKHSSRREHDFFFTPRLYEIA